MITTLVLGAGFGLGLTLIVQGARPARPTLGQALAHLNRPASPPVLGRDRVYQALGAPLRYAGLPRPRTLADLVLLQRDPGQHLAEQAAATLLGALIVPLAAAAVGVHGQLPLWIAVVGAILGFRWADARLRSQAQRRRDQLRRTMSVLLDLVTISLAGGAGLEEALDDAASICTGWAADRLRHVLATARTLRESPWTLLGQLGTDTAVSELEELAATMRLAGSEGARVRASLAARAAAMRTAQTAHMETEAEKAGERMSMPLVVLGLAYLIFLLYPPLANIGSSL